MPMAMGQKDGWPALGTFDIINMRLNGFQFHMDLMAHKVPWDDPKVLDVFKQWTEILPYQQPGANGRIWQDAAKTLLNKQAGMYLLGSVRRPAVHRRRPRRPRFLPVPGDRPCQRARRH